jgi:integrase
MPKQSKIKVTRFTYPNGSVAWRVSGSVDGKQIRKNFSDRTEALEEKQALEIRKTNGETHGRQMWVKITQEQHDDAWAALKRLKQAGSTKNLCFAVEFLLKHYREAAEQMTLGPALIEYLDEKSREQGRGIISDRQYKSLKFELQRFNRFVGDPVVGEVTPDEIRSYLNKEVTSLKTWNNRRGYLSTFFKFCVAKKYAGHDPVVDVQQFKIKHRRGTAETLSVEQVAELMTFLETYEGKVYRGKRWGRPGCMVPYFALAIFAGIRPDWTDGELGKLKPEHINLETGVIHIEPEVSKVNEKRSVIIQPNLRAWLEKYPVTEFPIVPKSCFREMRADIRLKFNLGHDVLRHTFISMVVGAFRSVGDAALQAGNSEAIIRKHYLDLKSVSEANAFWRICPAGTSLPEKLEKKDGRFVYAATATDKPAPEVRDSGAFVTT